MQGVEATDTAIGTIFEACKKHNYVLFVTADHGNAELLIDPLTGGPHTAHTTNPVPFILVTDQGNKIGVRGDGSLRDISPTILSLVGMELPKQMTGGDLRISQLS